MIIQQESIATETVDLSHRSRIIAYLDPGGERRPGSRLTLELLSEEGEWRRRFDYWIPIGRLPDFIEALLNIEGAATDAGLLEPTNDVQIDDVDAVP